MFRTQIRCFGALLCDLAVIGWVVFSVMQFFVGSGDGNMEVHGAECFRYFTVDSNILAALCSLVALPYTFSTLLTGEDRTPPCVTALRFVGTSAVALTFFTVVCFLGPTQGYEKMFSGVCVFLHATVPVFSMLAFVFCEANRLRLRRWFWLGAIPTAVYGVLYVVMVLILGAKNGGWEDFYGFNQGGFWYISVVAMLAASALLSFLLLLSHNAVAKRWRK